MKESASASHIKLDAANIGVSLWRNNVGMLMNDRGVPVRFGLCNDSALVNKHCKSSDLIGITSMLITPEMVGQMVGVFTAIETKRTGWVYSENDERAVAQKKFHDIVKSAGGFAGFASSIEEFRKIIGYDPR